MSNLLLQFRIKFFCMGRLLHDAGKYDVSMRADIMI